MQGVAVVDVRNGCIVFSTDRFDSLVKFRNPTDRLYCPFWHDTKRDFVTTKRLEVRRGVHMQFNFRGTPSGNSITFTLTELAMTTEPLRESGAQRLTQLIQRNDSQSVKMER